MIWTKIAKTSRVEEILEAGELFSGFEVLRFGFPSLVRGHLADFGLLPLSIPRNASYCLALGSVEKHLTDGVMAAAWLNPFGVEWRSHRRLHGEDLIAALPFENVAPALLYLYETKTYPGSPLTC